MVRLRSFGCILEAASGSNAASLSCNDLTPLSFASSWSAVLKWISFGGDGNNPSISALIYRPLPPTTIGIFLRSIIVYIAGVALSTNSAALYSSLISMISIR